MEITYMETLCFFVLFFVLFFVCFMKYCIFFTFLGFFPGLLQLNINKYTFS